MILHLFGFAISVIWIAVFLIGIVLLAFWPANVAASKGYSFIGFFIFSVFLFIPALIVAYLLDDRSTPPIAAA